MCKFTVTITFENYKLKRYQGTLEGIRETNKISDFFKTIYEMDSNQSKINSKISNVEYCK